MKYFVADQMIYLEEMYTRLLKHVDIYYWQYYKDLTSLQ